jgi:gliding motility-associated-like protein
VTADTSAGTKVHIKIVEVLEANADILPDVAVCDKYKLPELSSFIVNYYTEPGGNGQMLFANDLIEETQTLYIYAETDTEPNCTDESSFTITIEESPELPEFEDVIAKNFYQLPVLEMGNYYTAQDGGGTLLHEGDLIKNNQTIYVYVETGIEPYKCTDEKHFEVKIEIEIDFMPFFTPNGDGFNDLWRFKNDKITADSVVQIFDRYGKLVAEINPIKGWDGNYKGIQLPTSEYWYSFTLEDGKTLTGSFSLIRK